MKKGDWLSIASIVTMVLSGALSVAKGLINDRKEDAKIERAVTKFLSKKEKE